MKLETNFKKNITVTNVRPKNTRVGKWRFTSMSTGNSIILNYYLFINYCIIYLYYL